MPDYRKPTSQPPARDNPPPSDDLGFSIETTTMRLKSLKLRRSEAADKALDNHLREKSPPTREAPAERERLPAGRVRHDERGMAVWDWAAASGETAALSATNIMRKLDVTGLSIEQTQRELQAMDSAPRDTASGGDPYNRRTAPVGDPFKRIAAGDDPYNRGNLPTPGSLKRPVPKGPARPPGSSVLDQLTGKKK